MTWLEVVANEPASQQVVAWALGPGESSVLAVALARRGSRAVIDDLAGRRCVAALGVPVAGTLRIVLRARREGSIPLARPLSISHTARNSANAQRQAEVA